MYDILILGAGPAGLSAAVAARQKGRSVLVISNPFEANPLYRAERVDNYLGLPGVTGKQLLDTYLDHAVSMGAEIVWGRVVSAMSSGDSVYLTVGSDFYEGKRLILATGTSRGMRYAGEKTLLGKGVSYCATCDGMLYRGRRVVVVGRNKTAPEEANYLAGLGCQVVAYVSPEQPEGLLPEIPHIKTGKIAIEGEDKVTGVKAGDAFFACDGVFVLRDNFVPTDLFPDMETEDGFIKVDRLGHTSVKNVFAVGDNTGKPHQVSKAVGEGLIAANTASDELIREEAERKIYMSLVHFSKEGFEKARAQGGVMVVDFWASWCGPCKMLAPVIDKLAEQYEGRAIVGKVDVDDNAELAREFGIMSIPSVVIFKDGVEVERKVGVMPMSEFTAAIDKLL